MHIQTQIRALLIAFGIITMLFISIMIVGVVVINNSLEANKLIEHTAKVNAQIGLIRSLFQKSDIIAREKWVYGQNGDKITPARSELGTEMKILRDLTGDNVNQQKNIEKTLECFKQYFGLQDELIATAEKSGYDAASRIARDKNSSALNLDVGNSFTALQAEETALLSERSRSAVNANNSMITILVILSAAMFFAIPGAFMVAYITLDERNKVANRFRKQVEEMRDKETNTVVLKGDFTNEIIAALESTTVDHVHKSFA